MSKIKQMIIEAIEEKEEKHCLVFPIIGDAGELKNLMNKQPTKKEEKLIEYNALKEEVENFMAVWNFTNKYPVKKEDIISHFKGSVYKERHVKRAIKELW